MVSNMIKNLLLATIILVSTSGCSQAQDEKVPLPSGSNEKAEPATFKGNFQTATNFKALWQSAKKYRQEGRSKEAITALEKAYELADNRSFQGIALIGMAELHEIEGNLDVSANMYEAASKTTMNETQMIEFANKAQELRSKVNSN
jgi:tetratricopeptide (TPR) repeat protein